MHRSHAIDGREGDADAESRPGELYCHILRERRRIAQFDADLGRLPGTRWVRLHGDLPLGVRRIGERMQRHRRAMDLAETADQAHVPSNTLRISLHVHDWCGIRW